MSAIVASILAGEPRETLRAARLAARRGADWIELRLDRWPRDVDLAPLLGEIALPVLVACRTRRDGGLYDGDPERRRALLTAALAAGAEGIDLEQWEDWVPPRPLWPRLRIRSYHDLRGVPEGLHALRDSLLAMPDANCAKIVGTADDLAEAGPLLELQESSDADHEPTTAFAMGKAALGSRVLAACFGAPFAYAAADGDSPTAPGQPDVRMLAGIHDVGSRSRATRLAGLLGWPAHHSLGPWLHNRVFRRLGLDAVYVPLETRRPGAVLALLPHRRLLGLSVTAPHKETVAGLCHRLEGMAARTGVVNTLVEEAHGVLVGHNTDVHGMLEALRGGGLERAAPGETAAVLGAGGAARAAGVGLAGLGYAVHVLARDPVGARDRLPELGTGEWSAHPFEASALRAVAPRVVVHATPLGMLGGPDPEGRPLPGWTPEPGTYVLDMVYRPAQTRFLVECAAAGGIAISGLDMFLHQAALQVRLFTAQEVGIDVLREALGL